MRNRWLAAASLAAATVALAACGSTAARSSGGSTGSSGTAPAVSSAGGAVKTAGTGKSMVLTNSAGHTLYWFAIDTATKSKCNGVCATFWPPVPASAKPTSGSLAGKFGTITRADGSKQLTFSGHPLYTFKEDTAAGQDKGNGLKLEGGAWWAETPSGAKLTSVPAPKSSSSSGSGGGGYGY